MYLFIPFFIFFKHLDFPLTNLFIIYSLNYLFLNFWYFFIHKFNWFPQSKFFCVFECQFFSFTLHVCLCVPVTYLHVCFCIALYADFLFKTYICLYLCWSVYVCICVFLYLQYRVNVSV